MPKRGDSFDLICLKALNVDADSQRVALYAASIVVHAYAAGRVAPEVQAHALRIVDLARRFYVVMPKREAVTALVDDAFERLGAAGAASRTRIRDRLVQELMDCFHRGTTSPLR